MLRVIGGRGPQGGAQLRSKRQDIVDAVAKARLVGQQQPQRDRAVGKGGVAERPAEPVRDVAVEIEPPLLDEPHHPERDDELRDGRDPRRVRRSERPAAGAVGGSGGAARGHPLGIEAQPCVGGCRRRRRRGGRGCTAAKEQEDRRPAELFHPAAPETPAMAAMLGQRRAQKKPAPHRCGAGRNLVCGPVRRPWPAPLPRAPEARSRGPRRSRYNCRRRRRG